MDRRFEEPAAMPESESRDGWGSDRDQEEDVGAVNQAAYMDVASWPELTLRWRTRRGWPAGDGWWVLVLPGFFMLATVAGLFVLDPTNPHALENVGAAALVAGIAIAVVLLVPGLHQPVTADWELTVAPALIRLDRQSPRLGRVSQEIRRVDAGAVEVEWKRGNHRSSLLVSVTGSSVDGQTSIRLPKRFGCRQGLGRSRSAYSHCGRHGLVVAHQQPILRRTAGLLQAGLPLLGS